MTDEYYVETAPFRAFVAGVNRAIDDDPAASMQRLRGPFGELLHDDHWLPEEFARPAENTGMGGGIGSYLLYRNAERTLSISALVVPAGAKTPVHDHLAWGLVGLYRGEQFEEVFDTNLRLIDRRHLRRGEFYELTPPHNDIHGVVAANEQPSVSIHLLRNDVGCIHRHRFDPADGSVQPFRSGYVNVECRD